MTKIFVPPPIDLASVRDAVVCQLSEQGFNVIQIGEIMKLDKSTVSRILNSKTGRVLPINFKQKHGRRKEG